ncbi:MAG: hypothetical protein KC657_08910 [Myxococcales bacterium]|nr:hypothetical protein [Myxococcales bacterium]
MRRAKRFFVVACAVALSPLAVWACGSERPPIANASSGDGGAASPGTSPSHRDATSSRRAQCIPPAEIEGTPCRCLYAPGGGGGDSVSLDFGIGIPCGVSVCFKGLNETGYCAAHGVLLVLDGFCADASGELPRCDAGSGDAGTGDAAPDADASL